MSYFDVMEAARRLVSIIQCYWDDVHPDRAKNPIICTSVGGRGRSTSLRASVCGHSDSSFDRAELLAS